jgi:hypothetical protein
VDFRAAPVRYARRREEGDDAADADIDWIRGADVDASVDEDQRERRGGELMLYFLRVSESVGRAGMGSVVVVIVVVIATGKKDEEVNRKSSGGSSWE